jgi:hypothetical protein
MLPCRVVSSCFALAVVLLLAVGAATAEVAQPAPTSAQPAPAERAPENLKVLPKEWTRRQVVDLMKTWTADLGVRCHHCHAGDENTPFDEIDFAADEKETKQRARDMLKMMQEINTRLAAMPSLHELDAPPLSATCYTCHRGIPRPRRIEDVFEATRAASGLPAAIAEYRKLRQSDLIRGSYDFSVRPLATQARRQLKANDADGARQVMELAIELGLDGLMARMTLADIALAQDDQAAAKAQLEKALTLELNASERDWVQQRLDALKAPPAQ